MSRFGSDPLAFFNFAEAAVAGAQERGSLLASPVADLLEFQVADGLNPTLLQRQFGTVVDSGFFHLLDPEQCDRYVDAVASVLLPGGSLYLHEFAVEFPIPNVPRQVTADELRTRFRLESGWRIRAIREATFQNRAGPPVPAICACIERLSQ